MIEGHVGLPPRAVRLPHVLLIMRPAGTVDPQVATASRIRESLRRSHTFRVPSA